MITRRFQWKGPWTTNKAAARFEVTPRVNWSDGISVYKASLFDPPHHVIIFILAHNVHKKKSVQSEARLSDIYFLDEKIQKSSALAHYAAS